MGYTTDFWGAWLLNKALDDTTLDFLQKLANTRRVGRKGLDPAVYGVEGEFFVEEGSNDNVIDINTPPSTQPGLWCQWVPNSDGTAIEWDGSEKFYNYVEWIEYIVTKILAPKGYVLNGEVHWQGEESEDRGKIVIKNNKIKTMGGRTVYSSARKRKRVKYTKLEQIAAIDKRILALKTKKKTLLAG